MTRRHLEARRVLLEALLVVIAGGVVATAANRLSPRGLSLTRDYFPANAARQTSADGNPDVRNPGGVIPVATPDTPAERLRAAGLQVADDDLAAKMFADPRCEAGLILFVDARDEEHYLAGHIPGAIEFDRYHPEKYLAEVLPGCQTAEQIVVYCNGGDCEDSEFAALTLKDAGVASQKLFVYAGGIKGWIARGSLVETGPRRSGILRKGGQ